MRPRPHGLFPEGQAAEAFSPLGASPPICQQCVTPSVWLATWGAVTCAQWLTLGVGMTDFIQPRGSRHTAERRHPGDAVSPGVALQDREGPSWAPPASSSPDFVTVTFLWPLFLQVTSDFPQVLNFILQGFDLRWGERRGGRETPGLGKGVAWRCLCVAGIRGH